MQTQLIIIGAGPGGYETAVHAAKAGLQTVVIERGPLGGTCLNAGCIPTKCLCHTAEVLESTRHSEALGITAGDVQFSLSQAMARKDAIVSQLQGAIDALMQTPGITLVRGEARFVDAHTVAVGETTYTAPHIIIATGSTSKFLPIEGAHARGVLTSTEMLRLQEVPRRMTIIGGGVIGLEFAAIFRTFGSEVTVVEFCKEVLPFFDRDLAKRLRTSLKRQGIDFHVGAAAKAIHEGESLTVDYEEKGKLRSVEADIVLMAVGRGANLESLNFADAGIEVSKRGVVVDEHFQTSVPGVYAVGDINGLCQLAHAATFQGFAALAHILGEPSPYRLEVMPAAVFTVPEAAMVGKTEEQLAEEGVAYVAHKSFYRANGKALTMAAEDGFAKILTDASGRILGAHLLGAHAADLIHELAMVMQHDGNISEVVSMVHAHPSLSEIVLAAARH